MTHSFLLFVIYALAVFRLTHLVTEDTLTSPIREWLRVKSHTEFDLLDGFGNVLQTKIDLKPRSPYAFAWQIVTCPWCASPYIAAVCVTLGYFQGVWFNYVALVFAFSAVASVIAERL